MPRLNYPDENAAENVELATRIKAERGGAVPNLYRMLLLSPPVAEGWLGFLTAVRQKSTLPPRDLELAVMRVAALNGSSYEFDAHVRFGLAAGLHQQQTDALRNLNDTGFEERDLAILHYCDAMTRSVAVPREVFDAVRQHFDDRQMVELTAAIGAYNLVTRFLEALEVGR